MDSIGPAVKSDCEPSLTTCYYELVRTVAYNYLDPSRWVRIPNNTMGVWHTYEFSGALSTMRTQITHNLVKPFPTLRGQKKVLHGRRARLGNVSHGEPKQEYVATVQYWL